MKKLILTSAAVLCIGLTTFAQDNGKCQKKCDKKCDQKETANNATANKPFVTSPWAAEAKCNPENGKCKSNCSTTGEKKGCKTTNAK